MDMVEIFPEAKSVMAWRFERVRKNQCERVVDKRHEIACKFTDEIKRWMKRNEIRSSSVTEEDLAVALAVIAKPLPGDLSYAPEKSNILSGIVNCPSCKSTNIEKGVFDERILCCLDCFSWYCGEEGKHND